jgi:putative ABC transport system permease protein
MFKLIPYVLKTVWRHRSRSLLTVSGSATALFVFCFVGAVHQGMHDLQQRQESERALIVFQANKFCPATSHLPQDYDRQIKAISDVRDVIPIQVFTNNCRASLDVIVFYGIPASKIRDVRDFELVSGTWSDFLDQRRRGMSSNAAVMGRAVAARRNISVGEEFTIGGLSVRVAGIYTSNDPAEENYIYTHLDYLQRRRGGDLSGTVTQIEVLIEQGADASRICREIDTRYQAGPVETATRPKGVFQAQSLGDLAQLVEMARYLGYACVGLVLALVATTSVMSVQDRIKQHAVLQTIGFSGRRVFGLVLAESVVLATSGGLLGVGIAMATLQISELAVGAEAVTVAFTPSLPLALTGLLISILSGLLAGVLPAWHAARTAIVPALRQA